MKPHYHAAIIGLGNIAWRFDSGKKKEFSPLTHYAAYAADPRTRLIGGCSPDAADRTAFAQETDIPVFETVPDMLEQIRPDIVSICSPTEYHFTHAWTCLEMGVPMIWLEKPPTNDVDETDRLIQAAEVCNAKILVNYIRRYTPSYQDLKAHFTRKTFGECSQIQIQYSRGLSLNGSHILDLAFYLADDPETFQLEWVSGFGSRDNPSFAFTIDNRVEVIATGADLPYHNIEIMATCQNGRMAIRHGGMTMTLEEKVEHELFPGFHRLKEVSTHCFSTDAFAASMSGALDDLIQARETGALPQSNLISARKTQELIRQVNAWRR